MTVSSTTNKSGPYNGNGSTANFAVNTKYTAKSEVAVIVTSSAGVETTKVLDTHYTLTDPGDTGTVSFITSPTDHRPQSGETVTILTTLAQTQATDLTTGGAFSAAVIEGALDKLTRLVQQVAEQVSRSPKLRQSSATGAVTLPEPSAGAFLRWNGAADDLENGTSGGPGSGDVVGPASAVDNNLAAFDGTSGAVIKDSGVSISNVLTEAEAAAAYQPLDSDLTAIAALATTSYGRALLTLANATALAGEVDSFFLTPSEGNAAYQPLDSDLTAIAALSTTAFGRSVLAAANAAALATLAGLGENDNVIFGSITLGTADSADVGVEYALSDEGDYTGIVHTLSDDYFQLVRITRVASSDGLHVPMDIALASRGTLDSPSPMQAGDRSWAIAAAGRAANGTWQRLGYQWFEVKSSPSGNVIPGMFVLRVTKPADYFPRDILRADWTDGIRLSAHAGFDGVIAQTDAATIAWDVTQAQVAEVTLAGNRTLLPSGMKDGFQYDFYVTADSSARTLAFSSSGGLEWYLKGSDGLMYSQNLSLSLPANGFAHISMKYGGGAFIGTVSLITGHPRRAVVPSHQITTLTADRSGSNNNSAQAIFDSAADTLTVASSTSYRWKLRVSFDRAAGANPHTTSLLFGGTATFTNFDYDFISSTDDAAVGGGPPFTLSAHVSSAAAVSLFGPTSTDDTDEKITIEAEGIMRVNAGGTVIPQIQYSAAPGGAPSFKRGGFFECWPVGDNNVVAVGDFA